MCFKGQQKDYRKSGNPRKNILFGDQQNVFPGGSAALAFNDKCGKNLRTKTYFELVVFTSLLVFLSLKTTLNYINLCSSRLHSGKFNY